MKKSSVLVCYRCNKPGHFARQCKENGEGESGGGVNRGAGDSKESITANKPQDISTPVSTRNYIPGFPVYDNAGKQIGGKQLNDAEKKLTWCLAMDCEMVGVGPMNESALARVSIVNEAGHCVYNKFVKPKVKVSDYRTAVSGIRKADLDNAEKFDTVVWQVATILKDRVVVGHSLENDFKALLLNHPKFKIRDTSMFYKTSRKPALRSLARKFLNVSIQDGEHNSIMDAQAAMKLYLINRKNWEEQLKTYKSSRRRSALKPSKLSSALDSVNSAT